MEKIGEALLRVNCPVIPASDGSFTQRIAKPCAIRFVPGNVAFGP